MTAIRAAVELGAAETARAVRRRAAGFCRDGAVAVASTSTKAKSRLAAFGVTVPEGEVCIDAAAALAAAARFAPVAMKAVGARHRAQDRDRRREA